MWPLCQLVLDAAPYVPESLLDIYIFQVFIDPEFHQCDTDNGAGWHIRALSHQSASRLVPSDERIGEIKPCPARWELLEHDYPGYDDLPIETPESIRDAWTESVDAADGTKLGGWPYLVQSEIFWAPHNKHPANPEYAFQVDSEEKVGWVWGDAGVAYFGRGTGAHRNRWAMSWQCS